MVRYHINIDAVGATTQFLQRMSGAEADLHLIKQVEQVALEAPPGSSPGF
jgi:hypothetical protein